MPKTYEPIATQTLGSATASVTFSSIPGTYTDLVLVTNVKGISGTTDLVCRLNGDTGTNYSWTALSADGSSVYSERVSNFSRGFLEYVAYIGSALNANSITSFMNYANTTTNKTFLSRGNNASFGTGAVVNMWRSTSAITSILVYLDNSTNLDTGSTFTLYGIKAA
jgi:hypothetical protein